MPRSFLNPAVDTVEVTVNYQRKGSMIDGQIISDIPFAPRVQVTETRLCKGPASFRAVAIGSEGVQIVVPTAMLPELMLVLRSYVDAS